jgi:Tol biopolymer transport system component
MSIDRLERRLPDVLTELSLPRTPDYIDSLLSRTERMPQRPGWSFPERWIPMSTVSSTLSSGRPIAFRPLIVLAIVAALAAAALLVVVGSQRQLPPPFGLARNGLISTNNTDGDIVLLDPATNEVRTVVQGPNLCCSAFSPTGRYLDYLRVDPDDPEGDPLALVIANLDGSTVSEVPGGALVGLHYGEWSPAGDKELLTLASSAILVDVATGHVTPVAAPGRVMRASWIGTSGDILVSQQISATPEGFQTLRVTRVPASGAEPVVVTTIENVVDAPLVSPDGSRFLYFIWGPEERLQGRVHVYDMVAGTDIAITSEAADDVPHNVENPHWSPDGRFVASIWLFAGYDQVGITAADGPNVGSTVYVGPKVDENAGVNEINFRFSPDGRSLLAWYEGVDDAWLLPIDGSAGRQVPWQLDPEWGWQRLAP